jgi:hypothetical protein
LGALFTKVLISVCKDESFDIPFDLLKEKNFSSYIGDNVSMSRNNPKWKQALNILEHGFYQQVFNAAHLGGKITSPYYAEIKIFEKLTIPDLYGNS